MTATAAQVPAVRVLAICGPTAVGKSALGVAVAQRLGGEVISADSMQAYIGMDIGTATPDADEQGGVPHHLLDTWPAWHHLTVAEYQERARGSIAQVHGRGALPILVGGSGLYVSAILDDLRFPGTDPQVRARLEDELRADGSAVLHERLAVLDPQAAQGILPGNGRRIVRALEVIELTGGPFISRLPEPVDVYASVRVGLTIDRAELDERIAARVGRMWEQGFVEEVRRLAEQPGGLSATAARALGYRQVLALLAGEITEAQARQQTIDATRTFARRQQRWFVRDRRIHWIDYDADDLLGQVVGLVDSGLGTAQ
ncbi:MAG: tRNA (adenosine(37)-N6)-dimethylallyltransferase MiaA [Actinomycetales bacterium]|nr:tRNA (adenosine(37)-N6)-dimethylallyltransferase MiaA [Actinomycetales bacterium]